MYLREKAKKQKEVRPPREGPVKADEQEKKPNTEVVFENKVIFDNVSEPMSPIDNIAMDQPEILDVEDEFPELLEDVQAEKVNAIEEANNDLEEL